MTIVKAPILSIVIPTRNREKYLICLLEALISSEQKNFEIIVQDNSDNNEVIVEYLTRKNDERVIYEYTKNRLSVLENSDLSVSKAHGEYVCMLGDDDGLLLNQSLDFVKYLILNDVDAAIVSPAFYAWPSVYHKTWSKMSGRIFLKKYTSDIKLLDSQFELTKVLASGGCKMFNLPRVYHGFVKREILWKMFAELRTFFPGPSPDMANAIGLTKYTKRAIFFDFPLIIAGHSAESAGGAGAAKKHVGCIHEQPHLPVWTAQSWSENIPFFWSGPTIYAQTVYFAADVLKNQEIKKNINYSYLYAYCFVYQAAFSKKIISSFSNSGSSKIKLLSIISYAIQIFIKRSLNFLLNFFKMRRRIPKNSYAAQDIIEAIFLLNVIVR